MTAGTICWRDCLKAGGALPSRRRCATSQPDPRRWPTPSACAGANGVPPWVLLLIAFLLALPLDAMISLHAAGDRLTWHLPALPSAWHFIQGHPVMALTLLLPGTVLTGLNGLGRLGRLTRG